MAKTLNKRPAAQQFAVDLGELRTQRVEILGEIATLSSRTLPAGDVAARIDGLLAQHEEAARSWLRFANLSAAHASLGDTGIDAAFKHEPFGSLIVFGDRAAIRAHLLVEAEEARTAEPMPDAEFEAELAALRAQVSDVEHAEEALIREAELAGVILARREDANPALFLLSDEAF